PTDVACFIRGKPGEGQKQRPVPLPRIPASGASLPLQRTSRSSLASRPQLIHGSVGVRPPHSVASSNLTAMSWPWRQLGLWGPVTPHPVPKTVLSFREVGQPLVIGRHIAIALAQLKVRGGGRPFSETKRDRPVVLCTAG